MMKKQKTTDNLNTNHSVYYHIQQSYQEKEKLPESKKYSRQYYKLLHTLQTLTTNKQPISIYQCMTPLIFKNVFNQKKIIEGQNKKIIQIERPYKEFIQNCQRKRRQKNQTSQSLLLSQKEEIKLGNTAKKKGFIQQQSDSYFKKNFKNDEDDDGFQIGEKQQNEDVVQLSKRYLGNLITGFIPKRK